jgi:hypothetical protein
VSFYQKQAAVWNQRGFWVENGFLLVSADTKTFGSPLYPAPIGALCLLSCKHVGILTELRTKVKKMHKFPADGVDRNKVSVDQLNRKWVSGESVIRITGNRNIRIYYF